MPTIGLIGDYDAAVPAHRAIPRALELAARATGQRLTPQWLPTESIATASDVSGFDGLWCVPASPYRSTAGALRAICHAREQGVPFLGTCGGFQHAVLEYARNVLGWYSAEHAENAPDADCLVISPLTCALVEKSDTVFFAEGSHLRKAYGSAGSSEGYHCSFGLNPAFQAELAGGPLRVAAHDSDDAIRALELDAHPFFVLTLFQPERAALRDEVPPIVRAFVSAASSERRLDPIS